MSDLARNIEAILFLSARPVSFKKLGKLAGRDVGAVKEALKELGERRNTDASGVHLVVGESAAELGTNPNVQEIVENLTKEEIRSELTRPQLEALTIIAYRGPVTKAEIEHIRGVNCTIILRNLLVRGLIIEQKSSSHLQPVYTLSTEMLRHLGIHRVKELPDYEKFHENTKIDRLLDAVFDEEESI